MYTEKGNRGQGEELHQFQKPLSLSQANEVATDTATKIFTGVLRLQKQTTEGIETIVVHS